MRFTMLISAILDTKLDLHFMMKATSVRSNTSYNRYGVTSMIASQKLDAKKLRAVQLGWIDGSLACFRTHLLNIMH